MTKLILTCEHAVNTIPIEFSDLFSGHAEVLETHRAVDIGAKNIADYLATHLPCHLYQHANVSRLLIDCNRTCEHPSAFSEWSKTLSLSQKEYIIQQYYKPFRDQVTQSIAELIDEEKQSVLHLSIHSFTPVLYGKVRQTEIGLLYDPKRALEKQVATDLKIRLSHPTPHYRVRFNYPYLGTSNGFTTTLRKQWDATHYIGLELEMNQTLMSSAHTQEVLMKQLAQAISDLLSQLNGSA